jgi:hypothetical protein
MGRRSRKRPATQRLRKIAPREATLLKSKIAGDWVKVAEEPPEDGLEGLATNHIAARGVRKKKVAA